MKNLNAESHSATEEQPKTEDCEDNTSFQDTTGNYPEPPTEQPSKDLDIKNTTPEEISSESSEDETPESQLSPLVSSNHTQSLNVDV